MDRNQITGQAFAAWAVTYDDEVSAEVQRYAGVSHEEAIGRLLNLAQVEEGLSVLDVGTGTGAVAIRCALQDGQGSVAALDATPSMLARAVSNAELLGAEGVWLSAGSAERLPYGDGLFDVVVSSLALHHTRVDVCLREIGRVLKPGGRVAILDMGAPPAWRRAPVSWMMQVLVPVYRLVGGLQAKAEADAFLQTYTLAEWRALLAQNGLMEVAVEQVMRPGQWLFPCVILATAKKAETL